MDPVTAFSLTCGVIQVVEFSTKVVVKCRQIYKDGATPEHKEIESMAEHLTDLATDLKLPSIVQNPGSANQLYHDEQELRTLAEQCSKTATELIDKIQKLNIQGRQRKRDAFGMAVKAVWKKDAAIENIQKSLECYRRTLDTRILISLRHHVHLILSEQSDGIGNLDCKIQSLIIGVSENQTTFDKLKDIIAAENISSKEHISQEFQKHREKIATEESYKRLLESLYFPDIHAREEGIDEAHKQTFEWIFDEPGDEVTPRHNFVDWLKEGHGTYWISGKAGSGKSTLMSLICHDPRTEAALKIWSGTDELFMPNFFFWSPGSQLQKSLAGLLRSLICQILTRFPNLMPILAESTGPFQYGLRQFPTWTEQRLRATLQNLLSVGLEKCRLCIFIDGLDEFHGDHITLLNLISSFREITKVKFCLSSRRYSPFIRELGSSPMLKLQDLTEPDIRRYVSDKLEGAPLKAPWASYSSFRIKDPVDTIVQKAEGVFLWVHLAVRDQLEGIRNGDDTEQLRERLEILPTEIEEVYGHMLHGIDKVYRKEVARYIRSVLDVEDGWSLFEFALAEHKSIDDILLFSKEISIWDICEHCTWVGERIAATCKGFLEVRERQQDEAESFGKLLEDRNIPLEQCEELRKMEFLHRCTQIGFLHRTAFDFFKDNEQGQDFLNIHTTTNTHPQVLYVKALLAKLRTFPLSTDKRQIRESISSIMENASVAEEATGVAQLALMDLVNRSITLLWDRSLGQPSNIHWCRVWAKPLHSSIRNQHVVFKLVKRLRAKIPFNHQFSVCQPVDFLGLAAWYGLDKYVLHMLDLQSRKWDSGTEDYLLSCSVGSLAEANALVSKLKLIAALLKRGADPNMGIPKGTVWGLFLKMLHHFHLNERLQNFEMTKTYEYWSNTSKAFLESGANAHKKIYSLVYHNTFNRVTHLEIPPLVKLFGSMIELHLSARSVLQQCFAKDPKYLPLIASGATLYLKCSDVILAVRVREVVKYIDPKASKQQLSQVTNLCEQGLLHGRMLDRQFNKVFEKADIEQLVEQAPTMDELRDLLQREGSDEERPGANIGSTTDSSSIDAPASSTDEAEGSFYSAHSSQQEED